jgi:Domain of unknown function (DUF6285)
MFDEPTVDELLAAVTGLLRDTLAPQLGAAEAFQARVAVNALDLVRRELAQGEAARAEARQRLQVLLGIDAPLDELQAELARRIREREFTPATPGLIELLKQNTLAKMAVEQPGHALFKHLS